MKILHLVLLSATVLTTSSLYAQTEKTAPAYGDNPNLFAVLAHKTGVAVQNTVEKVGSVKIGVANLSSKPEKLIWDCNNNKINPKLKTHTIAYLAENRFAII